MLSITSELQNTSYQPQKWFYSWILLLKVYFEKLPKNGQILSSMLSIKFWWQSCHNECCLVEWQHYDSPTSEYSSNISRVGSRTVSELGPGRKIHCDGFLRLDTQLCTKWPTPTVTSLMKPNVRRPGSRSRIIYGETINTGPVNYGDVQGVEILN